MEQGRPRSDRTFALLYRTEPRRPGWLVDDRRVDRESAAGLLSAHELFKLLKLREISSSSSKSGLSFAIAAQTMNAINEKTQNAP